MDKLWKILLLTALLFCMPMTAQAVDEIQIDVPSQMETTISSGRSFYVSGTIKNVTVESSDQFVVKIVEKNNVGNVVREVQSTIKDNQNLKIDQNSGIPNFFSGTTEEDIKKSGMPDLLYDPLDSNSFEDGTIKCYFNDNKFTALIAGGSVPSEMTDVMNLVNGSQGPYLALPEGEYTIQAVLYDQNSVVKGETSKEIKIGSVENKILSRFSPDAHMNSVSEFAKANGYRIYADPFPGYWNFLGADNNNKFCEIAPFWRANDALEYTTGKVHFVIYNVKSSSTTYSLELGVLQSMGDVEVPDRLANYYYSTGEPLRIGDTDSTIVPFEQMDKLALVRAESSTHQSSDGVYNQDQLTAESYDMDVIDGVSGKVGDIISLYGVTAPIQLAESDILLQPDNTYKLNNKIQKLSYHITGENVDKTLEKEVLLNRLSGGWDNYSELEFKHNLEITKDMAGKILQVAVTGFDIYGAEVAGTQETFTMSVAAIAEDSNNNLGSPVQDNVKAPRTGDDSIVVLYTLLILSGGCILTQLININRM